MPLVLERPARRSRAGLESAAGPARCWPGAGPGLSPAASRGEDWQPDIPTPPFGKYVSGHSTFSAAAAAVLAGRTLGGMVGARALQAASELFSGWHHPGGTAA